MNCFFFSFGFLFGFHKSIEILFLWLAQFFHLITDLYKAVHLHETFVGFFQVFLKARSKAKEELKRHLAEFLSKRTVGLATIFGPSDAVLDETIHDKAKEIKIVESLLLPRLELLA